MKTIALILLSMQTFSLPLQAQNESELLNGKWFFNAPSAPYVYQEGELLFNKKQGELILNINLTTRNCKLKIDKLKKENFGYSCSTYIDGNTVHIKFIIEGEKGNKTLKVIAESGGEIINVLLNRTKEKA